MSNGLISMQAEIVGKPQEEIRQLLGEPVTTARWKTVDPEPDLTAAEVEQFMAGQLGEIWIYHSGRIHFSRTGVAVEVDEDVTNHLGGDSPLIV